MEQNDSNEELINVMREAEDLLEQLDGRQDRPPPPSFPTGIGVNPNSASQKNSRMKSVSKEMLVRLEAIDKLASQGYQVKKIWDAIPALASSSGIDKTVLASSPAGFSWIAFFFPFAVCTQIREWSYFYVAGIAYLAGSVLYKITGWDPTFIVSLAISYQYGFYFPYLRWHAIQNKTPEIDMAISIILGVLLSLACAMPSLIFEAIFIG
jgi:hypothetical protein